MAVLWHRSGNTLVATKLSGVTFPEVLAALAVLSVIASLAAPSFSRLLTEQRLRQAAAELRISLTTARSESVKRNERVSLLKSGLSWSNGWCVETASASECSQSPIQLFNAELGRVSVQRTDAGSEGAVTFDSWGRITGCPTFTLSALSGSETCALCLVVATDGRISSQPGTCPESACATVADEAMSWVGACP